MDWKGKVQALTHTYNCTNSQATGYSPFFLFYRRESRIPIDVELGLPENRIQASLPEFVKQLKQTLGRAYEIAKEVSNDQMGRYKKYFDQKHRCMKVEPGDLVMVRIKAFGRDHKIADKWESVPYRILNQNGKKPVFMVQSVKESGTRNIRTLHRNMLFPLSTKQYKNILEQNIRTEALTRSNILMAQHFGQD